MSTLIKSAATAMAALLAVSTPVWAQSSQLRGLSLDGNQPIQIESDKLEVRERDKLAVFTGNVSASQGPTVLKAGLMKVYYAGEGSAATGSADIERIEVSGKVYVKSNNQVATSDEASFDMRSEVLTMSGKEVVLSEGSNVAVGCKLTVQMKSGQAKLDSCNRTTGRVKLLINPKSVNR
jgi:lipopolysaccharide export system protein LptA